MIWKKLKALTSNQFVFLALRLLIGTGISLILWNFPFDYIESLSYDIRIRLRPPHDPSNLVQTVVVDRSTVAALQRVPDAKDHYNLLDVISQGHPKYIVYLIHPTEITGSFEDFQEFARIGKDLPLYIAIQGVALQGEEEKFELAPPLDVIKVFSGPKTFDRNIFAKDNVSRRIMLSYQGRKTLHPFLAAQFNPKIDDLRKVRGAFTFLDSDQAYIDFRPTGSYRPISLIDVLNRRVDPAIFKDKIVIVGRDTGTTVKDYTRTPYSRDIVAMSNLELHANMFDTLLLNTSPIRASRYIDLVFTLIITLLTINVVLLMRPTRGLFILSGSFALFAFFCYLMFAFWGIWIEMAHPFLAVFISYYFFIPYRLIVENRRSWEYQQKNQLLTQVEELKTNFLSLMSHDLKTPLARIQGMTEVALTDNNSLSEKQKDALQTISHSCEELTAFVSSILSLSRVESQEIKLNIQSKDINQLIHDVVLHLRYMAQEKNIQIMTELEPLFSVKIDIDLIRQVLMNLVENAIKYSPPDSRVLISSEESENKVIIQVADQGIGIPDDEIGHVFMKFFRSRSVKTGTKGSGLGLYLAKYFVELHKGRIRLDSRPQQGSTFTVELPMDPGSIEI